MLRKSAALFCLLLGLSLAAVAQKPQSANKLVSDAKVQAKAEQKSIFVIFGASWCPDCDYLSKFLARPDVKQIFDKHFVIVHVTVFEEAGEHPGVNNPDGEQMVMKFGGVSPSGNVGLPFMVMLDRDGKKLIDSNLPSRTSSKHETIGFPNEPAEIDWFLRMLKQGAPNFTDEEAGRITQSLREPQG